MCAEPTDTDRTNRSDSSSVANTELNEEDKAFLKQLQDSEFKAIDEFDKMVLTIAGGAFGVSFAFLKDIVRLPDAVFKGFLSAAWWLWSLTLLCSLASFYCSHLAMRNAQRRYRTGMRTESELGGRCGKAVVFLNPTAGSALIAGLICMTIFVTQNLRVNRTQVPAAAGAAASPFTPSSPRTNTPAATNVATRTNTPAAAATQRTAP